jgi:hypothetical protein
VLQLGEGSAGVLQRESVRSGQVRMKIEPICLPIYNDVKECLFQGDTHILGCKEEINELTFCQNNPTEYVQFLRASTPRQRLPKTYDFHKYNAKFDYN